MTVPPFARPSLVRVFGTLALGLLAPLPDGSHPIQAQTRDRGPLILELPASTRALSLGNAFALGFRDSDALFYQPGLLDRAEGLLAGLQRYGSAATLTTLSAGRAWLSGGAALGVQHLHYEIPTLFPTIPPTAEEILALSADEGSLREDGDLGVSELVVSAGYGRRLLGIRTGIVGKLVEQRSGEGRGSTVAVDLGLAASQGPLTVGLAIQNLGPDLSLGSGDIPLPTRFTLGTSSEAAWVGPLDLSGSAALSYAVDGDLIPSLGLEVAYWPVTGRTFVARVGYRHLPEEQSACPLTLGGAFLGDNIILEYALLRFDSGDPSHRFSLGWR